MSKIKIDVTTLYLLLTEGNTINDYLLVEDNIISSDPEDGGADHEYILQEISTGKFYKGGYSDWDIENTDFDEETEKCKGRVDLYNELIEVKPIKKKITVYE